MQSKQALVEAIRSGGWSAPTPYPTPEGRSRKNMRFCETNRIHVPAFFDVTLSVCGNCSDMLENLNPVRLAKPNPFLAPIAQGDRRGGYCWTLDTLAGGDIVKVESDKNCRI